MAVEVKICGVKTEAVLQAALAAGADYVGFVFYPRSPRNVDLETAARLSVIARGRTRRVALLVDADDGMVRSVVEKVAPDILQLHGEETPDRVRAVKRLSATPVMKALKVATVQDVADAQVYAAAADYMLFDAKSPSGLVDALPGGNVISFDWRILGNWRERWYMLSGGLTPDNVADAIGLTRAPAVDVSSGVERAPGEKDPGLIAEFIRAANAV